MGNFLQRDLKHTKSQKRIAQKGEALSPSCSATPAKRTKQEMKDKVNNKAKVCCHDNLFS